MSAFSLLSTRRSVSLPLQRVENALLPRAACSMLFRIDAEFAEGAENAEEDWKRILYLLSATSAVSVSSALIL